MKKTVAVFFGGRSTEHDISIITALSSIIKPLELTKKYVIVPIYIAKNGKWISDAALTDIKTYRTGKINDLAAKAKPLTVSFDGGFTINKKRIDIAFPAMHGPYGEDGSLMGLLRMAGIPFVGSDMDASVIAMDKVLAKQVAQANSIPTSAFYAFSKLQFTDSPSATIKAITAKLKYPLFVKPAHLGSSIGITKVQNNDELSNAIEVAAYYDNKIIVEEAVENLIEVTVPIIGNDILTPAFVERPLSKDDGVFDFDTKYINGGGKKGGAKTTGAQGYSELPAKLPDGLYDKSLAIAEATYRAIGAGGIARVDLLIDSKSGVVYFNEINPLPGSLYNHNWRASGTSSIELVTKLIAFAEQRFAQQQKQETTFDSNFLQQF
ncbi:MAG: D-alanine--D-alanine ligase [Candidatus Saccharibacteria bacterium]|nr:D-alanine--D-alanine ligase [Candidatus Saccharibacteria bacterium]